jgi:nicotinate phosphoribosyltransferase
VNGLDYRDGMANDLHLDTSEIPLVTDLYELTMAASYFSLGYDEPACFSLSVRRLPPRRGFLIVAGLERLLDALEEFRFTPQVLDYLESLRLFSPDFLERLAMVRFTGEIHAMPEGTVFFANEPILEVRAPLIEAQLLETLIINQVGMASLTASKAARMVIAAAGRPVIDFGFRRSQGIDAGIIAARSSYLAGFIGSSNVLAGRRYGIPLYGTMAHSYVLAHEREREAFAHFTEHFPQLSTLLVDTYDTLKGVENAAEVGVEMKRAGRRLQAVRLDSGDLLDLSFRSRRILDSYGLHDTSIFASGSLTENAIRDLVRAGAPIDGFGVGTEMVVSGDAPALDIAYKLAEYGGDARLKTSAGKVTLPGRKQVFRAFTPEGRIVGDRIGLASETISDAAREFEPAPEEVQPLLALQFSDGGRLMPRPTLAQARDQLHATLVALDKRYTELDRPAAFPVKLSTALSELLATQKAQTHRRQS